MYKIKVKKRGIGWECTLYKKVWLFFWTTDTTVDIKFDYKYLVNEVIEKWAKVFEIPNNLIDTKELIGTASEEK